VRIFLDTNVLVSAYTARGISADLVRFILAEHELLTGEVNLGELRRVLRDRLHASAEQASAVEAELRTHTVVPKPAHPSAIPARDPDDRWVLASAIAAAADLLVTGDRDLLDVADQSPVPIVDPRGCWERLRSRP
jgi:putative PIN family toxin of toxin-antitoxin system